MRKNYQKERNLNMYKAILELKTVEECKAFFDDLCSISEILAMEQRFEVAHLLYLDKIYSDIMAKTGASSAIISRVNRSLQTGTGGYALVFERMKEDGEKEDK
ncbi:MAG: TrpR-like protein [Oscillospiraceae bacterium]|nr:TrpR-like protein [Oscillospiraceae bacterium]